MKKKRKLTVKLIPVKTKDTDVYNVYCRVTYNSITTKFSLRHSIKFSSFEQAKERLDLMSKDKDNVYALTPKRRWIEKLIEYEIFHSKKEYSVVGLGKRMDRYQAILGSFLIAKTYNSLVKEIADKVTHKEFEDLENSINQTFLSGPIYVDLLEQILNLSQKKKIKFSSFFGETTFSYILATGAFISCNDYFNEKKFNEIDADFDHSNLFKRPAMGLASIGNWIINDHGLRIKFKKFVNSEEVDFVELMDKYCDGCYSKIISQFKIKKGELPKRALSTIDSLVNELIKEGMILDNLK